MIDLSPPPGVLGLPDTWVYRDWPWSTKEHFDAALEIIGKEHIRWLVITTDDNGFRRGQCFISPAGMENLKAYKKVLEESKSVRVTGLDC